MDARSRFLEAVLGAAGATALQPLLKSDAVAAYLVPRAAAAWLQALPVGRASAPGGGCRVALCKSATGLFDGVADVNGTEYAFTAAAPAHVAAVVSLAVGAPPGRPDLRDVDLARLGKTVDLLAKAQQARRGGPQTGAAARPVEPTAPEAPEPIQKQPAGKPKLPKVPKPKQPPKPLRLSVSESLRACGVCRGRQFKGADFTGCFCLRDLAKSVKVEVLDWGAGFELRFGSGWDGDAVVTLLDALGKR